MDRDRSPTPGSPLPLSLAVLAACYVAQGIVYGFAGFVLLPSLAARGVSLDAQVGVYALGVLPWAGKILWAVLVDRLPRASQRGPQAIAAVMMGLAGLGLLGLACMPLHAEAQLTLAGMWFATNLALSLQDVAVDALAIDVLPRERRGLGNAAMLTGHHLGAEGFSFAAGFVMAALDVQAAIAFMGVLVLAIAGLPWLVHGADGGSSRPPISFAAVLELLGRPRVWLGLLLSMGAFLADAATSALAPHLLVVELGWSPERIAQILSPAALIASLVGFVWAAWCVDALGHVRAGAIGSVVLGLCWIAFAGLRPRWHDVAFVLAFVLVQALVTCTFMVGLHAWLMDRTDPDLRATHFTLSMSALNLSRVLGAPLGPLLVTFTSLVGVFAVAGVYQLAYGVLWLAIAGRRNAR